MWFGGPKIEFLRFRAQRKNKYVGLEHIHFHESTGVSDVSQKANKRSSATNLLFHPMFHARFTSSTLMTLT